MAPLTLTYASIAQLIGIHGGDLDGLTSALSWIPPLLGCLTVLLGAAVARSFADDEWIALAAAAMIALDANCVRPFKYGFIDHHLYGQIAVLLLVLARLRRRLAIWIFGLTLFYAMTPEATFYVAWLLGLLGVSQAFGRSDGAAPVEKRWQWFASPAIVAGVVLALLVPTRPPANLNALLAQAATVIHLEERHNGEAMRSGPSTLTTRWLACRQVNCSGGSSGTGAVTLICSGSLSSRTGRIARRGAKLVH